MKKITEIILDKEAPLNLEALWVEPQEDSTVVLKVLNNGKWASTLTKGDLSAYQTKTDESLQTSDKTIAGAINELNSNMSESGYNLIEYGVTTYDELVEMAGNGKPSYLHLGEYGVFFFVPASIITGPNQIVIYPGVGYSVSISGDSSLLFGVTFPSILIITNENVWPDAESIMCSLAISNNIDEHDSNDKLTAPSCETVKNYVTKQLEPYATTTELSSLRNELQQTETGVATANSEIEKLKSGKQDIIIPGTGLAFDGNILNVTLDTNVFFVAASAPASPSEDQKKKICLVPADTTEEGNFYTEYVWVVDDEHPDGYWEEFGTYKSDVDLSIYQTKTDNNLQTTDKTIVGAINEVNSKSGYYISLTTLTNDSTSEQISEAIGGYDNLLNAINNKIPIYIYVTNEGAQLLVVVTNIYASQNFISLLYDTGTVISGYIINNNSGVLSCSVEPQPLQKTEDDDLNTSSKIIVGAINEVNGKTSIYTIVPELTADYTIPANATTREYIYEISIGATTYNVTAAEGIKWIDNNLPLVEANSKLIVSVVNNIAVWGTVYE